MEIPLVLAGRLSVPPNGAGGILHPQLLFLEGRLWSCAAMQQHSPSTASTRSPTRLDKLRVLALPTALFPPACRRMEFLH